MAAAQKPRRRANARGPTAEVAGLERLLMTVCWSSLADDEADDEADDVAVLMPATDDAHRAETSSDSVVCAIVGRW